MANPALAPLPASDSKPFLSMSSLLDAMVDSAQAKAKPTPVVKPSAVSDLLGMVSDPDLALAIDAVAQAGAAKAKARDEAKAKAKAAQAKTLALIEARMRARTNVRATWAKLRDGSWGIRAVGAKAGDTVTVVKKNGQKSRVTLGASKGRGLFAKVGAKAKATGRVCPGNNNCRRLGWRIGPRCRGH